ncbi:hypothetical protein Ddc_12830 [Ditylenchus destructor]|nr:hypothetical protein Ddc_12830 [Ditylenchus destructor]
MGAGLSSCDFGKKIDKGKILMSLLSVLLSVEIQSLSNARDVMRKLPLHLIVVQVTSRVSCLHGFCRCFGREEYRKKYGVILHYFGRECN